ncbi:MAG: hypothetical protein AAFO88_06390, partial [Pseudomonadota bacterium]
MGPAEHMTEYQIIDLHLELSTKQDALWAIFFSVHMAIFGGIIYVDRPLRRSEKVFAIIAYIVFAAMNFVALRAGQRLMETLRTDLASLAASRDAPMATLSLFESSSRFFPYQEWLTLVIHAVAAALVIGAIAYDRPRE